MLEMMEFVRNGEAVKDQNRCTSARKLTLNIASAEADLAFSQITFPNISSLKIIFSATTEGEWVMPFSKIWELWPSVEELEVSGNGVLFMDDYDSEFCGIHPEEVKLLRRKSAQHLKTINTVPTTYNMLSMKSKGELCCVSNSSSRKSSS